MKLGVDTNILVRSFVNDGTAQFVAVARMMRENEIVVGPSVLLEAEWVLRDTFDLGREQVATAFETLLGVKAVTVLHREAVVRAVKDVRSGCDFAYALHLALSVGAEAFLTFDRRFARRAAALGLIPPVKLLPVAP